METKMLSVEEVADKLGISKHRVRRLIGKGDLGGLWDGYSYRILDSELLRWMDAHKIRRQ